MNVPKKQHYVPKSYLRGFRDPEKEERLWVYSKQGSDPNFSTPESVGYETYTYAVSMPDGSIDKQSVEKWLSTIDEQGISIIRKLDRCNSASLSEHERTTLSSYIAMMFLRNPVALKNVEVMHEMITHAKGKQDASKEKYIENIVRTAYPDSDHKEIETLASGVRDILVNSDYNLQYPKGYSLRIFETATAFARVLTAMRWVFVHCRGSGFFVTSDNPVFFGHPDPESGEQMYGALEQPDATLTVPITKTMALLADWKKSVYSKNLIRASGQDIRMVNSRSIAIAHRFVYSPFKSNRIGKEVTARRKDSVCLTPDNELMGNLINQLLKEE